MSANLRSLFQFTALAILVCFAALPAQADIVWTGAVSGDIFDEANWNLTGSTVTAVDPNVTIADNVLIKDAAAPVDVLVVGQQGRFQLGDNFVMTIDNSMIFTSGDDGLGGEPATTVGPLINIVNGGDLSTFFITNRVHATVDSLSTVHLAGGATPINNATIDITVGSRLVCTNETPADFINEHLNKISVDAAPAVVGANFTIISDGGLGCQAWAIPTAIGTPYCFGDGSGMNCPCGNAGATGSGCANGTFAAGAQLAGIGSASAIQLELTQGAPNQPVLFFRGDNAVQNGNGALFGDGLRCAGGNVLRMGVAAANASGIASMPGTIQSQGGAGTAGQLKRYQGWYRDPLGSPCGSSFNLSNGLEIGF